jgi:uncharacterized membrane protein YoaK (UPF0700 family)
MTGTTTQIMIDLADIIYARKVPHSQINSRITRMSTNVIVFATGCGAAALLYARYDVWCFLAPPLLSGISLLVRLLEPRTD